jgi:hypothetical protein
VQRLAPGRCRTRARHPATAGRARAPPHRHHQQHDEEEHVVQADGDVVHALRATKPRKDKAAGARAGGDGQALRRGAGHQHGRRGGLRLRRLGVF